MCVDLTRPDIDILDEAVRVESLNDENSVYIPPGTVVESESSLCIYIYACLLCIFIPHTL